MRGSRVLGWGLRLGAMVVVVSVCVAADGEGQGCTYLDAASWGTATIDRLRTLAHEGRQTQTPRYFEGTLTMTQEMLDHDGDLSEATVEFVDHTCTREVRAWFQVPPLPMAMGHFDPTLPVRLHVRHDGTTMWDCSVKGAGETIGWTVEGFTNLPAGDHVKDGHEVVRWWSCNDESFRASGKNTYPIYTEEYEKNGLSGAASVDATCSAPETFNNAVIGTSRIRFRGTLPEVREPSLRF